MRNVTALCWMNLLQMLFLSPLQHTIWLWSWFLLKSTEIMRSRHSGYLHQHKFNFTSKSPPKTIAVHWIRIRSFWESYSLLQTISHQCSLALFFLFFFLSSSSLPVVETVLVLSVAFSCSEHIAKRQRTSSELLCLRRSNVLETHHSSPILYTKMMLSVCPMAIFVESGENAIPLTM